MRVTVLTFLALSAVVLADPEAVTPAGTFRGRTLKSYGGREYSAFSGIPYARPPIGSRRFKEPEPMEMLDDVYDATAEKEDCLQMDTGYNKYPISYFGLKSHVGSEDCLYLNVYTPDLKPEMPYPVMVLIHGGAFIMGSGSSQLVGPSLLMDRDVIVVSINYRLGPFGFLTLDDDLVPGNAGMKDQAAALKWVQRNIVGFGGDPARVTIFGESAGGASVHLHMHSPLSKGKFIRAISESGTSDCSWAKTTLSDAKKNSLSLVKKLGCEAVTAADILTCLREKTGEEVIEAAKSIAAFPLHMVFKPVTENNIKGAFLTQESLDQGSDIPWISGVNSAEGLIIYGELVKSGDSNMETFQKTYQQILPYLLHYQDNPDKEEITKKIKQHYLQDKIFSVENLQDAVDLFSHGMFTHGLVKSSRKHKGPMYQYYFTHRGQRRYNPFMPSSLDSYGVDHAEELLYLLHFEKLIPSINFNEADKKVANMMLDMWTDFATYGNPTPKGSVKWPYSKNGKITAEISTNGLKIHENLFDSKLQFWDELEGVNRIKDEL